MASGDWEILDDAVSQQQQGRPQYKVPEQPSSLADNTLIRGIGRNIARGVEGTAGALGDVARFLPSMTSGNPLEIASSLKGIQEQPTAENIRENVTKKLTGNYLEPQSPSEEGVDEILQDTAALLLPFPNKSKSLTRKSILGALGKSALGNFAKWRAEEVTGSKLAGAGVKIGTILLANTAGGRKEINEIRSEKYKNALSNIPENTLFDISPEKKKIDAISRSFSRGDHPDKKFILERLDALDNLGALSNKYKPQDLISLKQDWNKYLQEPSVSKSSKDTLKRAVNIVNEGIARYGEKNNKFYGPYKMGEELTRGLNSSNYVQRILSEHPALKDNISNPILKKLLFSGGGVGLSYLTSIPTSVATGAGAIGTYNLVKSIHLFAQSPEARKYYYKVINDALKDDSIALAKSLKGLDKATNKITENNPEFNQPESQGSDWEIID